MSNESIRSGEMDCERERDERAFNRVQDAIAWYLKYRGWNVAVIGDARIQQWPPSKINYEFVMRFTGSKPETDRQV